MKMIEEQLLFARSGLSGAPSERIDLVAGLGRILISRQDYSGSPAPVRVMMKVAIKPEWEGSEIRLTAWQNGVFLRETAVARFGETTFWFVLRSFGNSAELSFDVTIKNPGDAVRINNAGQDFLVLELGAASCTLLSSELGQRQQIAFVARDISERLGLRGVYMKSDRRELFTSAIISALRGRYGYSVLRLGDGEGRVLGFPECFSEAEILTQVLYYHFGPRSMHDGGLDRGWVSRHAFELRKLLLEALSSADVIGLPVFDFFRDADKGVTSGMVGYGCALLTALPFLEPGAESLSLVGTNVFQQLAADGRFFRSVTQEASSVTIIGPWDLRSDLRTALDYDNINFIEVPRHFTWGGGDGPGQFPLLYKKVVREINCCGDLRGQLFLVGAGLLGKHYVHTVKSQGGVALDIGSVFDSWAGKGLPYAVRNSERFNLNTLQK